MAIDKLLAEWFWTDRWVGSSAFMLPIEPRGLYREMLTQAWRRGASLPNDHEAIKRAVGATDDEWLRSWPKISGYFRAKNGRLFNPTQVEIYRQTKALIEARSDAGRRGGLKTQSLRRQANRQANHQANGQAKSRATRRAKSKPPSPISNVRTTPHTPLSAKGGRRPSRRELQEAKEIRARVHGGCPHHPRCATFDACVHLIASHRKARAS